MCSDSRCRDENVCTHCAGSELYHDDVCDIFAYDSNHSSKGEGPQQPQHIHDMRCQLVDFSDDSHPCIEYTTPPYMPLRCHAGMDWPLEFCSLGCPQASSTEGQHALYGLVGHLDQLFNISTVLVVDWSPNLLRHALEAALTSTTSGMGPTRDFVQRAIGVHKAVHKGLPAGPAVKHSAHSTQWQAHHY